MKSKLIELRERNTVRFDKRNDIHTNGADNAYPTRMERIINASPTAKACARAYAKFMMGAGFAFNFPVDLVIGKTENRVVTPASLLKSTAHSISYQRAFAWHVNYNILGQITSVAPISVKHIRVGRVDSDGYAGLLVYYDNWDQSKSSGVKSQDFEIFNVFNPNPKIVQYQIDRAGGIQRYNGQILLVNLDEGIYPLSPIDPAQDDADTESQLQVYKNRSVTRGWVGKKVLVTNKFENQEDKEAFHGDLKNLQGADSDAQILHLEVEMPSDDKRKAIDIAPLDANIQADVFNAWTDSLSNSIRKCFNNIPTVLVEYIDGKLGNTSGESFKTAQAFYNNQTAEERQIISEAFRQVFLHYYEPINPAQDWNIVQLNLIADAAGDKSSGIIDSINTLSPLVANKVLEKMTDNEIRDLVGLQPVAGGDDITQPNNGGQGATGN